MTASMKWPPKLDDDTDYEAWKEDILMWCDLTDIPEEKQALAIHLALTGQAHTATGQIGRENLKKKGGVKVLLEKLDTLYLADKGSRQFAAFNELYNLRRNKDMEMNAFVAKFEQVYFKFSQYDMELPDAVKAFMLLASSDLGEEERRLVMSAVPEVSYNYMKQALKRIFCEIAPKGNVGSLGVQVKTEPVFFGNNEQTAAHNPVQGDEAEQQVMYSGNSGRGRGSWRGGRGRGVQLTGGNRQPLNNRQQFNRRGKKGNPVGRDGRVTTCYRCGSRNHWARMCPDPEDSADENNGDAEDHTEIAHLSLFVGYANNDGRNRKMQTLIQESAGHAVLDTGCSSTVCGVGWLETYLGGLSEYERSQLREEESDTKFKFGVGDTVSSMKKVSIPCWLGKATATITTDVVDCDIPLLLSKRSMKKAKMNLDFGEDTIRVNGADIKLGCSTAGHYLLPISM